MAANKFNPAKDIPDLSGKVILVTGGNIGLGKETVLQFAKHNPSKIFLCARTEAKARGAIDEIAAQVPTAASVITFVELDLASFDSVKRAAASVTSQTDKLHVLINNAGIMAVPAATTRDGYEIQFGTNHMGHALLTRLLLPTLLKTAAEDKAAAGVRIVNVSSAAEAWGHKNGPYPYSQLKTDMASTGSFARYGISKLANVHHARVLAARNPSLTVVSVHPGTVNTNLGSGMLQHYPRVAPVLRLVGAVLLSVGASSVAQGARNQLWAAAGEGVVSGEHYWPVGVAGKGSPSVRDEKMAEELWEWTEKELDAVLV